MTEIRGIHVLSAFVVGFGIIIAVNLTLAINAVRSFPGLEVKNSYVASQGFETARAAQDELEWGVHAWLTGDRLHLSIRRRNQALQPQIEEAIFGRATHVAQDQAPAFQFQTDHFIAPVQAGSGNWNLRLKLRAKDGTLFSQRVVVEVRP